MNEVELIFEKFGDKYAVALDTMATQDHPRGGSVETEDVNLLFIGMVNGAAAATKTKPDSIGIGGANTSRGYVSAVQFGSVEDLGLVANAMVHDRDSKIDLGGLKQ